MSTIKDDPQEGNAPQAPSFGPDDSFTDIPVFEAPCQDTAPFFAADIGLELIDDAIEGPDPAPVRTDDRREAPALPDDPLEEIAPTVDSPLLRIVDLLDQNRQQMAELNQEFQSKLKYDAHKEKIIDSLHKELQEYKHDFVKKHLHSVLLDVIKIIDDIRKWVHHYRTQDPATRDSLKLFKYLENIPSDLEDIFYWQGVKAFTCSAEEFDPVRQRAVKKVDTVDPGKDKLVAESLRSGYEWEGKIIRPEMVAVFQYKQPLVEPEARGNHE